MSAASARDREAAKLAATLPTDRAALLAAAMEAITSYNAAVLACDQNAADHAAATYEAIIWTLNGGEFFGCMDRSNPEAGGIVAERHCRAAPGTVPMWGQTGEFLVTVEGIRVRVDMDDAFGMGRFHFGLHAVDHDAPFLSETGYRSHFGTVQGGWTVEDIAGDVVRGYLAEHRAPIARDYRDRIAERDAPEWLAAMPAPNAAERVFTDHAGQMAFGF